eukprot:c18407_g1_i1 orf=682-1416(-)
MGRPPAGGAPVFRFLPKEVLAMEKALEDAKGVTPSREVVHALADMFSASPERAGKVSIQWKQIWNWFQNRRHAARRGGKPTEKQDEILASDASISKRPLAVSAATSGGKGVEPVKMEFEAKSSRDAAWYDVHSFLAHRMVDSGDPEVRVRFAGFGPEEDEWVNVRSAVRQRSLPCEAAECVAVLPGDLILCFQEGNDQALYYDAYIKEVERRRHDVRGCRCRFLVQYEHDGSLVSALLCFWLCD